MSWRTFEVLADPEEDIKILNMRWDRFPMSLTWYALGAVPLLIMTLFGQLWAFLGVLAWGALVYCGYSLEGLTYLRRRLASRMRRMRKQTLVLPDMTAGGVMRPARGVSSMALLAVPPDPGLNDADGIHAMLTSALKHAMDLKQTVSFTTMVLPDGVATGSALGGVRVQAEEQAALEQLPEGGLRELLLARWRYHRAWSFAAGRRAPLLVRVTTEQRKKGRIAKELEDSIERLGRALSGGNNHEVIDARQYEQVAKLQVDFPGWLRQQQLPDEEDLLAFYNGPPRDPADDEEEEGAPSPGAMQRVRALSGRLAGLLPGRKSRPPQSNPAVETPPDVTPFVLEGDDPDGSDPARLLIDELLPELTGDFAPPAEPPATAPPPIPEPADEPAPEPLPSAEILPDLPPVAAPPEVPPVAPEEEGEPESPAPAPTVEPPTLQTPPPIFDLWAPLPDVAPAPAAAQRQSPPPITREQQVLLLIGAHPGAGAGVLGTALTRAAAATGQSPGYLVLGDEAAQVGTWLELGSPGRTAEQWAAREDLARYAPDGSVVMSAAPDGDPPPHRLEWAVDWLRGACTDVLIATGDGPWRALSFKPLTAKATTIWLACNPTADGWEALNQLLVTVHMARWVNERLVRIVLTDAPPGLPLAAVPAHVRKLVAAVIPPLDPAAPPPEALIRLALTLFPSHNEVITA